MTVSTFADGSTQQRQHDALGRVVAMVDELGRTTTQRQYDALVAVTDALNHTTSYGYDEQGRLTSQTDANGHTTSFAFDARGRQIARTLPDGATETKTYDAAGNALTRTDFAGRTTVYSYDAMNRLLSRSYPDGSSVSFAYTPTGRRASFSDSRGTTTYGYDARDRVTLLTYPDGRSLAYAYDALGHRTALTANVGGQSLTTTYGYDDDERPSSVFDPLGGAYSVSYDDAGRMVSMSYPNGTATAYGYDTRNRSTSIVTTGPGGSSIQSYALTLDAAGRRMAIAEGDGANKAYGYDAVDRLVSENVSGGVGPSYTKAFSYDPVGNRLSQDTTGSGAGSVAYSYDSRDRLTSEGATAYSSDTNGNVTSKSGEATYTWDFDNRLVKVEMASGVRVEHAYDPDGNRVSSTTTPAGGVASTTDFLVDSTGRLSHVVVDSAAGLVGAVYVRLGDTLLAALRPLQGGEWQKRMIHTDYVGSVRVLSDETGLVAVIRGYEAFGSKTHDFGVDGLVYNFAGEPWSDEAKLAYHRARWLDVRVGAFRSEDPFIGTLDRPFSLHRYGYTSSSPVNLVDPSGLIEVSAAQLVTVSLFMGPQIAGALRLPFAKRHINLHELSKTNLEGALSSLHYISFFAFEDKAIFDKAHAIVNETLVSHPYGAVDGFVYLKNLRRNGSLADATDPALAAAEHFFFSWDLSVNYLPVGTAGKYLGYGLEFGYDFLKALAGTGPYGYYGITTSDSDVLYPTSRLTKAAMLCGLWGFAYGSTTEGRARDLKMH